MTFGTRAGAGSTSMAGWTIYDVSLLLGHADVKTTKRYIGADQKKRLHELVAKRTLTVIE
jgi:hypothetical protein